MSTHPGEQQEHQHGVRAGRGACNLSQVDQGKQREDKYQSRRVPPAPPGEHPDHSGEGEATYPDRSNRHTVDRAGHRCSGQGDDAADDEQEVRFSCRTGKACLFHHVKIGTSGAVLMPILSRVPILPKGSSGPYIASGTCGASGTYSAQPPSRQDRDRQVSGAGPGAGRPDIGPMMPGYLFELCGTLPAGLPLPPCYPGIRPAPMGRTAIQPSRCERRVARRKKPSPPRSTGCRRPLSPHRRGWRAPRLAVATARSAPGPGG